jgi:hypothetical protein
MSHTPEHIQPPLPDSVNQQPDGQPENGVNLPAGLPDGNSALRFGYERGGAVIRPEDEGKTKGLAVRAMEEQTQMQMDQIYQQMKLLASQAEAIAMRKELSERIYRATMRFEPIIGRIYFLYHNKGNDILSLIAPHEWGRSSGYERYIAELRLLADHTWEILEMAEPV